ncbi:hypothetical protein PUMCH_004190 [Australozyma saopauloensis]|uniref:Decapping nuclease n=1 Tax=Australozyma saopauloensis TaxID=291208 RepID=A0AAX4HE05_9ASCO|nr:hypothetical protein PUMCH_004190 [[Candida] saopauloensis]
MPTIQTSSRSANTALKQPKELFSYSRTVGGTWNFDEEVSKEEAISYFYFPDSDVNKKINLSDGLQNFQKIPDMLNVADFPSYLRSIQNHEQETGKKIKADIITFRGIMTKLLTLPYNLNSPIDMYAIAYDGQIFLKNNDELDQSRRDKEQEELSSNPQKKEHLERCEYVGYKFETITTLPKPWAQCSRPMIEKRPKKVVNNYEQYISVVRSGIGKVKTVLAGEVDCIWDFLPEGGENILPHYAELKTSRVVDTPHHAMQFEKKLFRTWAQCFLIGIKRVVYGFRDDQYILKDVEVYDTEEIPLLIKDNEIPRSNNPRILCIEALKWYGALLEWLVQSIDRNNEQVAYKIRYVPGQNQVQLSECSKEENEKLRNGAILSEEFKQWRDSIRQT